MSRRARIVAVVVVILVAIGVPVRLLLFAGGGSTKVEPFSLATIVNDVAPGASVTVMAAEQAVPGATALQVKLPPSLVTPPPGVGTAPSDSSVASVYAGAGWRGVLIASVAALRIPALTQFVTTNLAGAQAPGAAFYLDGSVRSAPMQALPRLPMLDKVGPAAERKQLDDNLALLRKGLPAGSLINSTVKAITVDPAAHGMAYSVELKVRDLRALRNELGDIFGLATGLAPGPDSTVEGLAIHAVDLAGRNAGTWIATRTQQATTVVDPAIHAPRVTIPRMRFVNETGGPIAVPSAPAGPIG